jgi:hypothetical protein
VLNGRSDQVVARTDKAGDGGVVTLGAAGIEHNLGLAAMEELRKRFARCIDCLPRALPLQMNRRCVPKLLHPVRAHRLHHLWKQRRGGIRIAIDSAHSETLPI